MSNDTLCGFPAVVDAPEPMLWRYMSNRENELLKDIRAGNAAGHDVVVTITRKPWTSETYFSANGGD